MLFGKLDFPEILPRRPEVTASKKILAKNMHTHIFKKRTYSFIFMTCAPTKRQKSATAPKVLSSNATEAVNHGKPWFDITSKTFKAGNSACKWKAPEQKEIKQ